MFASVNKRSTTRNYRVSKRELCIGKVDGFEKEETESGAKELGQADSIDRIRCGRRCRRDQARSSVQTGFKADSICKGEHCMLLTLRHLKRASFHSQPRSSLSIYLAPSPLSAACPSAQAVSSPSPNTLISTPFALRPSSRLGHLLQ